MQIPIVNVGGVIMKSFNHDRSVVVHYLLFAFYIFMVFCGYISAVNGFNSHTDGGTIFGFFGIVDIIAFSYLIVRGIVRSFLSISE